MLVTLESSQCGLELVGQPGQSIAGAGTLTYVLAYGGLRWGEMVALRRSRWELLRSRIHIDVSAAEVGGRLYFGATKSHKARTVVLPAFLTERLARQLTETQSTAADPLVFATATGQPLRHSNFWGRVFKPAALEAGLTGELRIHDLRLSAFK